MLLDDDLCENSSEGASAWAGRLSAIIMQLRDKVRDYAEGRATLDELLEEAKVSLKERSPEDEPLITELLLNQLNDIRHAVAEHRRSVMRADAHDVVAMAEANKKLWSALL